jgi:hypothetical protein
MNAYWKYNLKYSKALHLPNIKQIPSNINQLTTGILHREKNPNIGRAWKSNELRLKSDSDLHKLWYVLLKEKLAIKSDQYQNSQFSISARKKEVLKSCLMKVNQSMQRLKSVVVERQVIRNEYLKFLEFYYIKKKQTNPNYTLLNPESSEKTEDTVPEEAQSQSKTQTPETPKQRSRVVRAVLTTDESKKEEEKEEPEEKEKTISNWMNERKIKPVVSVLTENEKLQVEMLKKRMNENIILKEYVSNSYLLTKQQKDEVKSMIGRSRGRQARNIFMKEMAALSYKLKSNKQSNQSEIRKLEDLS